MDNPRVSFRGGRGEGIRPCWKLFAPPWRIQSSNFKTVRIKIIDVMQCLAGVVTKITLTHRSASNFCKLQLVIEKRMKIWLRFLHPRLAQIASESISDDIKAKMFLGGMPPDPTKWCTVARYSIAPSNFLYVAFCPTFVILSKRNPEP